MTFLILPGTTTFDHLHSKLLFYEEHMHCRKDRTTSINQASVASLGMSKVKGMPWIPSRIVLIKEITTTGTKGCYSIGLSIATCFLLEHAQ